MQQTGKTDAPKTPTARSQLAQGKPQEADASTRLEMLRDEIKLHLHLAGMDAKETWSGLEAQLEDVLRSGRSKADAAQQLATDTRDNVQGALEDVHGALEDLQTRFELFRDSLKKAAGH